ncbi:MAG: FMN-binding protein [Lachnospiraceae bacterium]|nr:FMN-binding protein [Lachnospiraceae bacterium]
MKNIVKNTIILLCITLVVGVLLGLIYEVTAKPRAEQAEKAKQAAYQAVFADAVSFEKIEGFDYDALAGIVAEKGVTPDVAKVTEIVEAYDASGNKLGEVFTVETYKGYDGLIKFTVGIQSDGTVNGYSILDISETAGLGMKAKTSDWGKQFEGKNVDHFEYTKSGASADYEVDAIAGATRTTRAMVNGINAAVYAAGYLNGEGGQQ